MITSIAHRIARVFYCAPLVFVVPACAGAKTTAGPSENNAGSSNSSVTGGTSGIGGSSTLAASSTGGTAVATSTAVGGTAATGGSTTGVGGTAATGGTTTGMGGTAATGGTTVDSTGGTAATRGTTVDSTGGTAATGGTTVDSTGGTAATGGSTTSISPCEKIAGAYQTVSGGLPLLYLTITENPSSGTCEVTGKFANGPYGSNASGTPSPLTWQSQTVVGGIGIHYNCCEKFGSIDAGALTLDLDASGRLLGTGQLDTRNWSDYGANWTETTHFTIAPVSGPTS